MRAVGTYVPLLSTVCRSLPLLPVPRRVNNILSSQEDYATKQGYLGADILRHLKDGGFLRSDRLQTRCRLRRISAAF